jgi:hypothetical protein
MQYSVASGVPSHPSVRLFCSVRLCLLSLSLSQFPCNTAQSDASMLRILTPTLASTHPHVRQPGAKKALMVLFLINLFNYADR